MKSRTLDVRSCRTNGCSFGSLLFSGRRAHRETEGVLCSALCGLLCSRARMAGWLEGRFDSSLSVTGVDQGLFHHRHRPHRHHYRPLQSNRGQVDNNTQEIKRTAIRLTREGKTRRRTEEKEKKGNQGERERRDSSLFCPPLLP